MVVSGCAALLVARPPTSTVVSPTRPAIWGPNRGVGEIQLGLVARALEGLDCALFRVNLGPGRDLGLLEVHPSGLEDRLGGGEGLPRIVEALLGSGIGSDQRGQTIHVDLLPQQLSPCLLELSLRLEHLYLLLGELEVGLPLRKIPLGPVDLGLVRAIVELVEDVALLDAVARVEPPLLDVAVHPGTDFHRVLGIRLRHPLAIGRPLR